MPTSSPQRAAKASGKARKVNQVLVNRMIDLRKQGFSCEEIAQKVQRSERTVRRYTRLVRPTVSVAVAPTRVDVLASCGKVVLQWRERLQLDSSEVDFVFKKLRQVYETRDPLTREWLTTDEKARLEFLMRDVLRPAMSDIKIKRWIVQLTEQIGSEEATDEDGNDIRSQPSHRLLT